jgi:hypothetical protein
MWLHMSWQTSRQRWDLLLLLRQLRQRWPSSSLPSQPDAVTCSACLQGTALLRSHIMLELWGRQQAVLPLLCLCGQCHRLLCNWICAVCWHHDGCCSTHLNIPLMYAWWLLQQQRLL